MTDERIYDIKSLADLDGRIAFRTRIDTKTVSAFWKIYNDHAAYYGEVPKPFEEVSMDEVIPSLKRVPDEDIYPLVPDGLTLTKAPLDTTSNPHLYIKRPALCNYHDSDFHSVIRDIFLAEAQTLEQVSKAPHENIMAYHGCLLDDGRLKGIVLTCYKITLADYVRSGDTPLDIDTVMTRLRSAVDHLHSLGLAHNDLNPHNIMLDENDAPIVIDLGSCQPAGGRLMSGGSVGWSKSTTVSVQEHDVLALGVIREWLVDPESHIL
ncbi:kinase-like domain-containing protein [Xylariaceae sp. FL1019]|nr:kinase-like domain-containing protein [Xylariaceae sp. FL1019]